jgi:hypothetical protein
MVSITIADNGEVSIEGLTFEQFSVLGAGMQSYIDENAALEMVLGEDGSRVQAIVDWLSPLYEQFAQAAEAVKDRIDDFDPCTCPNCTQQDNGGDDLINFPFQSLN